MKHTYFINFSFHFSISFPDLLGLLGAAVSPFIADNGDWFLLAGFIFLLVGVFVKGL